MKAFAAATTEALRWTTNRKQFGRSASSNLPANANVRSVEGSETVSEAMATFSPGAISINAEVSVTFLLN